MKKLIFMLLMSMIASLVSAQWLTGDNYGTLQIEIKEKSPPAVETVKVSFDESFALDLALYRWQEPAEYCINVEQPSFLYGYLVSERNYWQNYRDHYCYQYRGKYYDLLAETGLFELSRSQRLPERPGDIKCRH